ncbi:MAG: TetR/AcrR family transcriptional regulator [Sulfobacillus acidophilus]|uniref:TetR/AcrR family transcriptional regulator n=1 Tax=Sulfobacillus acidophilus TaxID=53633 RepID=A0A2T2WP93_9FIRM|nr:MAG: TetR/AcrR family transcriptional regulator [Sulfobacillus acidophilus]
MARRSRRDIIIEAAAELFAEKGFRATTVRDIADVAGVLSGSLYAHIATKEDLYLEIVRRAAYDFRSALAPIVQEPNAADVKLGRMIAAHLLVIEQSRAWARVYLDDDNDLSQATREEARKLRRDYERLWDTVLQDGIDQGLFRVEDESLARLFILSALNGVIRWYRPDGRLSSKQVAQAFAPLVLRVLGVTALPSQ